MIERQAPAPSRLRTVDRVNSWNLPWQTLQRRLAVEPRAESASNAWLARARIAVPPTVAAFATLSSMPGRAGK